MKAIIKFLQVIIEDDDIPKGAGDVIEKLFVCDEKTEKILGEPTGSSLKFIKDGDVVDVSGASPTGDIYFEGKRYTEELSYMRGIDREKLGLLNEDGELKEFSFYSVKDKKQIAIPNTPKNIKKMERIFVYKIKGPCGHFH